MGILLHVRNPPSCMDRLVDSLSSRVNRGYFAEIKWEEQDLHVAQAAMRCVDRALYCPGGEPYMHSCPRIGSNGFEDVTMSKPMVHLFFSSRTFTLASYMCEWLEVKGTHQTSSFRCWIRHGLPHCCSSALTCRRWIIRYYSWSGHHRHSRQSCIQEHEM